MPHYSRTRTSFAPYKLDKNKLNNNFVQNITKDPFRTAYNAINAYDLKPYSRYTQARLAFHLDV
jgi:hypothetical protein